MTGQEEATWVTTDTTKGCLQLQTSSSFSDTLPVVFTIRNFRYSQEAAEVS